MIAVAVLRVILKFEPGPTDLLSMLVQVTPAVAHILHLYGQMTILYLCK